MVTDSVEVTSINSVELSVHVDSIGEEMVILFSVPERLTPSRLQVIVGAGTPLAVQLKVMSAVSFTDTEESIPRSVIAAGAVMKNNNA